MRKRSFRNFNIQKLAKWIPALLDVENKKLVFGCSLKNQHKSLIEKEETKQLVALPSATVPTLDRDQLPKDLMLCKA